MGALDAAFFLGGLVLLVGGAELLVRGASRLASQLGISPLVVGLTVVALGTSSPEIAVSVASAASGSPELALGNVIGSNIANVLLILGLSALITPLVVRSRIIRIDVPVLMATSALVLVISLNGVLSKVEGVVLLLLLALYVVMLFRMSGRVSPVVAAEFARGLGTPQQAHVRNAATIVLGLFMLLKGSDLLLTAAVSVASSMGVSELVIGLTLVAVGTSLPEIATSVLAAIRNERDIAVGNVIGSNMINLLAVLGVTALVAPGGIPVPPGVLDFDLPFMVAVAVACLPIFMTGHQIGRRYGALFLGYYLAYTAYLLLKAAEHDALAPFSAVMAWFVVPLTLVTLASGLYRSRTVKRAPSDSGRASPHESH
ncbi:MAG: calcium/sodium antiporter [Gemmatimonadota bacterium]|nr:calcium/sodium antiporter [Gemmatimonadota bacterium]